MDNGKFFDIYELTWEGRHSAPLYKRTHFDDDAKFLAHPKRLQVSFN